ncbi:YopX family protein [Enterococcus casseliflavus]|uniref:YopX family protein n=1 Tax=Enterococcus casseliflavus TaxID=37734 RepID=UPI0023DB4CC5|nr:YopX family protein [Enterococcus casseliflavus]WEL48440.1 YopX family protein [Enterococcus casseliflavus]
MVPKFRGKRKDNGEWVVGVPIPDSFCNVVHMIPILLTDKVAYPPERLHEYLIEILPETLGQSTGLKDKNGVEIFEGDVIGSQNKDRSNWYVSHHKIVWHDTGFVGKQICSSSFIGLEHWTRGENGYVVIGNIYENPELLEQADES